MNGQGRVLSRLRVLWRCGWCAATSRRWTPAADGCGGRSNGLHRWVWQR